MHIGDEAVQRFVDGEMDAAAARAVRAHAAVCAECTVRIDSMRRDHEAVDRLLKTLDHPVPTLRATDAIVPVGRASPRTWRRAATIALLVLGSAGAAYALPGSPLHGWLQARLGNAAGSDASSGMIDPADVSPEMPAAAGGIAIGPGRTLLVQIESAHAGAVVDVSLHDGALVEARASGPGATFTSDAARILIRDGGPSTRLEVRIPRTAPHVEIRVGQRTIFTSAGGTVSAAGAADRNGVWTIALDGTATGEH